MYQIKALFLRVIILLIILQPSYGATSEYTPLFVTVNSPYFSATIIIKNKNQEIVREIKMIGSTITFELSSSQDYEIALIDQNCNYYAAFIKINEEVIDYELAENVYKVSFILDEDGTSDTLNINLTKGHIE